MYEWKRPEDELPETQTMVLVTVVEEVVPAKALKIKPYYSRFVTLAYFNNDSDGSGDGLTYPHFECMDGSRDMARNIMTDEVKAWMYLPKSYPVPGTIPEYPDEEIADLEDIIREATELKHNTEKRIDELFDQAVEQVQRENDRKSKRTDDLYDAKVKEIDDDLRRRINELKEQGDSK